MALKCDESKWAFRAGKLLKTETKTVKLTQSLTLVLVKLVKN